MASKTSTDWPGQRVDHSAFAAALAERRAAIGTPDLPRNAGKRRTPSKKVLLKAIEGAGGKW
jgi:hypothetical protein